MGSRAPVCSKIPCRSCDRKNLAFLICKNAFGTCDLEPKDLHWKFAFLVCCSARLQVGPRVCTARHGIAAIRQSANASLDLLGITVASRLVSSDGNDDVSAVR